MKNRFREALLARTPTLGAWIQVGHPAVAEVFGRVGFDWIAVDLEHGAIDVETMTNIFRAIEHYGAVPVARLPFNDPIWIKRVLDAGAGGLIIPMVNSRADAEAAMRGPCWPVEIFLNAGQGAPRPPSSEHVARPRSAFLEDLARGNSDDYFPLIMDGAGWHGAGNEDFRNTCRRRDSGWSTRTGKRAGAPAEGCGREKISAAV